MLWALSGGVLGRLAVVVERRIDRLHEVLSSSQLFLPVYRVNQASARTVLATSRRGDALDAISTVDSTLRDFPKALCETL